MEYPGSSLKKSYRLAILISFITLFFLISPIVILYTAGYRYKNGLIRIIGGISIDIQPKTIVAYINDQKIKETIPIKLNDVTPNRYNVRLTAPGYYDWYKQIEVKNKQTVYIKDVTLIKKENPELLVPGTITLLSSSPQGNYIIYGIKKDSNQNLVLRATQAPFTEKSFLSLPLNEMVTVTWASQETYFAVHPTTPPYHFLKIFTATNPTNPLSLTEKTPQPIEKIIWKETNDSELYFGNSKELHTLNLANESVETTTLKPSVLDWYMAKDQVWGLQMNTSTAQLEIIKNISGSANTINALDIPLASPDWVFAKVKNNTALLYNKKTAQYLLVASQKHASLPTQNYFLSRFNDWWLFWSPWELWAYSENQDPYTLNRSGEELVEIQPLDAQNTLLLKWTKKVTVLFPYYFVQHDLIDHPIGAMATTPLQRTLYFIENTNKQPGLWKLNY